MNGSMRGRGADMNPGIGMGAVGLGGVQGERREDQVKDRTDETRPDVRVEERWTGGRR